MRISLVTPLTQAHTCDPISIQVSLEGRVRATARVGQGMHLEGGVAEGRGGRHSRIGMLSVHRDSDADGDLDVQMWAQTENVLGVGRFRHGSCVAPNPNPSPNQLRHVTCV